MKVYSTGYGRVKLLTDVIVTEVTETRVKGYWRDFVPDPSANFDVKRQPKDRFFLGSGSGKRRYSFTQE